MASGGNDKVIKIWNSSEPYSCLATLSEHKTEIISMLQLKEKEFLVSAGRDDTLRA